MTTATTVADDERRAGQAPTEVPVADSVADSVAGPAVGPATGGGRSFVARHRLPLTLAVIALCGYVGSIVYIVYVRGQAG